MVIVGVDHGKTHDLDVNVVRKETHQHALLQFDVLVRLVPPHRELTLDQAMEFARDDEAEVTPESVRLRKAVLWEDRQDEGRAAAQIALRGDGHARRHEMLERQGRKTLLLGRAGQRKPRCLLGVCRISAGAACQAWDVRGLGSSSRGLARAGCEWCP